MLKKVLIIISLLFFPLCVNATNQSSDVYFGNNLGVCTNNYQDKSISTEGSVYFSHCMEAKCVNRTYKINYYNNNSVTCSNGNTSPYTEVINNSACKKYNTRVCNNGEISYCSLVIYYDCSRTSSGGIFTTTTKTTTTRRKTTIITQGTTTTETTTQKKVSSTKLSSLKLSSGKIDFSSDKYEYEITLDDSVTSLNVTAVAEDGDSTVKIEGNNKISNGSIIKVIVTNNNGDKSTYSIKVKKLETEKKSNNANLKSLKIRNHEFAFNSKITNYSVIIESNETELDIYEITPDDVKASVDIKNNENLSNGSKIEIVVTAEDGKTTKIYTIDIRVRKQSNLIKVLFIIIIILSVIALGYYIYKKIVSSKTGDKYEYE